MGTDGTDGSHGLEERVASLETRIARIEASLSAADTPQPAATDPPPSAGVVLTPATGPGTYWQTPPPPRASATSSATILPVFDPSAGVRKTPATRVSLGELEERLAGRALAVVGGVALILGAIFFLSLAFSRGWIGPELRVLIGLAAGTGCLALGAAFLERRNRLLGHVLTPVGLAIISISLIGATRLYHIVPTEVGLVGALLSALAVAVISVRNDSQLVAAFGLISVLVAPPLLGATADSTTLAYIGAVLIGTTSIALWRSWRWLPPIAFLLTVPQAAAWISSDPSTAIALFGIAAYWALNVVAAGGEEFRRHRRDLSASSATLLLGNAAFVVWAGFVVLEGELAAYRGAFLLAVAAAHLAVGGYFVARDGDRSLFALLTLGTGIAALTMAMPIQLGAPAVPVAWTAEAVALAWVAVRRGHPYSAAASSILFVLAGLAIVSLYPLNAPSATGFPFLDARGGALAFYLAGVAVGIWIVRDRSLRSGLGALGLAVAMYCAATVLTGLALVFAATALMVVAAATIGALPMLPGARIAWSSDGLISQRLRDVRWRSPLELTLPLVLVWIGALAAVHLMAVELPLRDIGDVPLPSIPFTDAGAIGAGILIGGVLLAGWIIGDRRALRAAVLIAGGIAAYAIPFEVEPWAVTVLWVCLGVGALLVARREPFTHRAFDIAAAAAVTAAGIVAILVVTPPSRLVVGSTSIPLDAIVASAVSLMWVGIGMEALARYWPDATVRRWIRAGEGVLVVYLLSVLAVDLVGTRIGQGTGLEELQTQGQVVLSVLWAILGVGAFVYGLRSGSRDARLAGLVLLAIATTKVFLFDLSALDVAYRVISLIALGLLLLISAWLWQRAQPKQESGPSPVEADDAST